GQNLPEEPERRLRPADRPYRSIEIAALVPLAFRRRLYARKAAHRSKQPDTPGNRKIRRAVYLLQIPLAGRDRDEQAGDVQYRKRDRLAPRKGVADAPVERVRAIFRKSDDVGLRFHTREPA